MTDLSTIARSSASHCEARKIAYRQSKDGLVVSFVVHPNDMPDALALANLGSRWMLALVEIGDDEEPKRKEVMCDTQNHHERIEAPPRAIADNASRVAKRWDEMVPAQQAAIRCNDVVFQQFLVERHDAIKSVEGAAECVREICEVASRRDILPNTIAHQRWANLDDEFKVWNFGPACGAAS